MSHTQNPRILDKGGAAVFALFLCRMLPAATAIAAIFLACAARVRAQTPQPAELVLPSRLVAGEPATLAVLDATGRLVPRAPIYFSDGSHTETDVTGHAYMIAPLTAGAVIGRLTLQPGIMACTVVLPHAPPADPEVLDVPPLVSIHDPFEVRGAGFRGDAASNHVAFNGVPAVVLASSPAALVVLLDSKSDPGAWKLLISSNDPQVSASLVALAVEFNLNGSRIVLGTKTKLTVRVRGTDEPQSLEVQNFSPRVISFSNGDTERIRTRGGVDNSASLEVRTLHGGDFSFRVRVLSAEEGEPDISDAYAYLEAAQRIAPPDWKRQLDPVIARLEGPKANVKQALSELEKLMPSAPQGDVAVFLSAAHNALHGH